MNNPKTMFAEGASALHEGYEKYEEMAGNSQLAKEAAKAISTGKIRPLNAAVSDRFGPSAPWMVGVEGVLDGARGEDHSGSVVKRQAAGATVVVGGAVISASASGAGALAGYAGIASAVSTLGGGAATTAIASAAGLTAASGAPLVGAAATTALVSAVGGPVIAAGLVVSSVAAVGYGAYKAANWLGRKLLGLPRGPIHPLLQQPHGPLVLPLHTGITCP